MTTRSSVVPLAIVGLLLPALLGAGPSAPTDAGGVAKAAAHWPSVAVFTG